MQRALRRGCNRWLFGQIDEFITADRSPHVVGHDQRADDEQQASDRPDDVEGVHGLDRFDERVLQEAELVVGAPHQPCRIPLTHIDVM